MDISKESILAVADFINVADGKTLNLTLKTY